jgi:23S rRNA (uracil1939-C5)-methyltransferase
MSTLDLCKHYSICGGCSLQHLPYEEQIKIKEDKLKNVINSIVKNSHQGFNILPTIPSPKIWYYRNKMEFVFGEDKITQGVLLGLREKNKYWKIVNIEECKLLSQESNFILELARKWAVENKFPPYNLSTHKGFLRYLVIRESKNKPINDIMVNLVTTSCIENEKKNKIISLCETLKEKVNNIRTFLWSINDNIGDSAYAESRNISNILGSGEISEFVNGYELFYSAYTFFQPNSFLIEKLYQAIKKWLLESGPMEFLADLYCGVGGISIYLSDKVKNIVGVELQEEACKYAEKNAQKNNIYNCKFIVGDVGTILKKLHNSVNIYKHKCYIFDPPRAGINKDVAHTAISQKPDAIIYVCCNVNSLKNILLHFVNFYRIRFLQLVDMFPHTGHFETIILLERKK